MSTQIDWLEAKSYYLSAENVSYDDVSRRFGVSLKSVGDRALVERWVERRKEVLKKVDEKLETELVDDIVAIKKKHLTACRLIEEQALKTLSTLEPKTFDQAVKGITSAIELERKILGLDRDSYISNKIVFTPPDWFNETDVIG